MTADDIRFIFSALSEGDVNPLVERLTDDAVLEFPGSTFGARVEGVRKIKVFLRRNQRLFQDGIRFHVQHAHVAGDRAVAQWATSGRTRAGKDYANRGVTVFTLAGDKITKLEDYLDTEILAETWPR